MKVVLTVVVCVLLFLGAIVFVAYSGAIDVAATRPHLFGVHWFLDTTQESSVAERAGEIEVPPLGEPDQLARGLEHYHSMCATCHGAPGIGPSAIGRGLNPAPPDLAGERVISSGDPAADFWIVKHGIRMTGMPAFGPTHDDGELWAIVAFVQELPRLSPADYASRARELGLELPGASEHEHGGTLESRAQEAASPSGEGRAAEHEHDG